MVTKQTIGRPWRDVDADNEFDWYRLAGRQVTGVDVDTGERISGTLASVDIDGVASLEHDGFCVALVHADTLATSR